MLDEGRIGTIIAGAAAVQNHGMEAWHPNPDFFFLPGGGPMLDLGPYYVANLINLLGPVQPGGGAGQHAVDRPAPSGRARARARRFRSRRRPTSMRCWSSQSAPRCNLSTSLGCLAPPPQPFRALWHRRHALCARPELLRRHGRGGGQGRQGRHAVEPWDHPFGKVEPATQRARSGQLPHGRAGRHGRGACWRAASTAVRWSARCTGWK